MIVNGRSASEIWVNLLTPERAAELNRAYEQQRREERRRIDDRFTFFDSLKSRKTEKRFTAPKPSPRPQRTPSFLALAVEQENRIVAQNQKRLLDLILE